MQTLQNIHIDKIVFGGQALAHDTESGKVLFVWNALPGEIIDVQITKSKKNYQEGIATKIIQASPDRLEPKEDHFLSTSPWQIISWEKELEWKKVTASEVYRDIGKFELPNDLDIVADQNHQFGYRNKMEFSFTEDDSGEIQLAFFKRGHKYKMPIDSALLAHPWLNSTAKDILSWIRQNNLTNRNLKSLIVRSNERKETLAALFIKDELFFDSYPELNETLKGFKLFYSTHKSPASVPTKLIYSEGEESLTETISTPSGSKIDLSFGIFSFFQVNIPIFESALVDMYKHLPRNKDVVDYYSGVGAIGLSLADKIHTLTLIDSEPEAIEYAIINMEKNSIMNCQSLCSPSEKMTEF
ncbi:class I SAM-dependent RNA methyltransferase, partial [candidate division WWE3 bacterium]|nr:class I SAM-dependent RNA methyltransferase [candidate division WWE3 bacterium]